MSEVVTFTIKGIGDFSDVVNNVGSVQKALTKLKLPDKLGDSLSKNITSFYKEYEKYQKKISEGIKSQSDYNQVEKSLNNMRNLYQAIGKDAQKLTQLDMKDMLNLDTGEFKKISDDITNIIKQIGSIKIDTTPFNKAFDDIRAITKNSKISGENGLLNQIIGHINTGQIAEAKKALQELQNYANKVAPRETASGARMPGTLSPEKYQQLTGAINMMNGAVAQAEAAMNPLIKKHDDLQKELEETKQKAAQGITKNFKDYNQASNEVEKLTDSLKRMHQEEFSFNREALNIDRQIQSYFGLSQMIRKVGDIARDAFATVKELDKAMTETAVVTNFSVGDMWEMLPTYTAQANQLGSTIRDVYEAATLYYQQGLNTNQAMGLANETLKMARIAGLGAKEATDMMTAALRGFNMEVNQMSAQKINDVYSELAAITASDTKEIGSAMERTASIANSANMEFATTSAFLAQMIETTREAPENLGTAMKTIVARFQEMKQDPTKLVDSEGVAMDANKVDKALKTIGINLMNTKGEFRDLDDVFLDISQRWDSLTQGQQRYIATIAAGSRQQSRFIAMMSNYERTMELVDAANNSAGASQRQFEKTLDSMEAKLNKLKNAWDQFTMGLMNNQILKVGVDILTEGFTIVNKFIDALSKLGKPFGLEGLNKSLLTLVTTLSMLNLGKRGARGLVMGGAAWFKGEGGFMKNFSQGWNTGKNNFAQKQGKIDAQGYRKGWTLGLPQNSLGQTIKNALNTKQINTNIGNNLVDQLVPPGSIDAAAKEDARLYLTKLAQDLRAGKLTEADLSGAIISGLGGNIGGINIDESALNADFMSKFKLLGGAQDGFQGLANSINNAGFSLQQFGSILEGTPLEGFGNILVKVGAILNTFSSILNTTKANFLGNVAIQSGAIKTTEGLSAAQMTEAGTAALATAAQTGHVAVLKLLGKALLSALKTFLPIIMIIGALVVAYKALDHFIITNKEALESATSAAAAASDAYDSAKQEVSELADAIDKIREADSAFDGLVVGTAAFNEQLITANSQIMELIKKYPMLNDYLTTDKNGVMHISEEGLTAVKEYQKQLQANASALNILQTNDLKAEETKQQIEALRRKDKGGSEYSVDKQQNKDEIELLEKRIKAEDQAAKLSAVNTALVGKEIANREKVSAILADQYDMRKSMVQLEGDKHDKRQQYAEFYGYNYNRSTKKMTDIEGNEIDFDDKVIEDALKDITILADFEVDANSIDTAIASIDKKFSKQFNGGSEFFSDILSDNIETNEDLLKDVLQNPDKLENAVNSLSEKEIAAVLGVSADAVVDAPDKYKDELIDKLTVKAENIAESQSEAWGELGAMIAQSEGMSVEALLEGRKISTSMIQTQLKEFTSEQRDIMTSIGKTLQTNVGVDSMKTFISGATDIYRSGIQEAITEFNSLVGKVNWESPTARLKAYKNMAKSSTSEIKKMGQELLKSADSANLLGEAFEEFYSSSDWTEVSENMDKFVDSTGKINAVGVKEMAQECHTLKNLLDTNAISAGGVAAAINALGTNGELTLLDLNSAVLRLLTSFGQLDEILGLAHNSIENFDWGIDTGESADFVKESAEKWNELYKGGEVGNSQLEAYAKYVLGEEKYIKLLSKNHGDLQATMDTVSKTVNEYADGFDNAWSKLANGQWKDKKLPKELKNLGISFGYDKEGNWEWNPGTATTEQLSEWLQAVKGIGPEMAAAMIEDWQNYSPNFRAERQRNDFHAGLDEYIKARSGDTGVTVTTEELETISAATGESIEEVRTAITEAAESNDQKLTEINNTVGTTSDLNRQYNLAKTGNENKSWIEPLITEKDGQKRVDASQAITQAIGDGFEQAQAESMVYDELSKAVAQGTDVWYKDKLLTPEDLASFDSFKTAITEFEDNKQWVQVGEAIAEGYINYMNNKEKPSEGEPKPSSSSTNTSTGGKITSKVEKPSQKDNRYTDTGTRGDGTTGGYKYKPHLSMVKGSSETGRDLTSQDKAPAWVNKFIDILSTPPKTKEPTELTPAQQQKMYGQSATADETNETSSSLLESSTSMEVAANSLNESSVSLSQATSDLSTAAQNLTNTATILATNNNSGPSTPTQSAPGMPSNVPPNQQSSANSTVVVDSSPAKASLEELNALVTATKENIEKGATFNVDVTGADKLDQASKDANDLVNKNGKGASIAVSTGAVDKDSVKKSIASINKSKATILVDANTKAAEQKARTLANKIDSYHATIDIYPNFTGNWEKRVRVTEGNATGKHNHGYISSPSFGSAARGSYGQVGPRGKGGLTLTGELGYEIAWIPSENRSMILGANGPQMVNLPGDAVVWTHEQSKKIIKQKAVPAGSLSTSTRPNGVTSTSSSNVVTKTADSVKKSVTTAAVKVGKVSVWWENIARQTEAVQRKADKAYTQFEKYIKTMQATLKTTGTRGGGNDYIKNMSNVLGYNQAQYNKANSALASLDTSKKKTTIKYKQGKKQKSSKIKLGNYITKDSDGAYIIDQTQLNKVAKSKSKGGKAAAQAIKAEAEKRINDNLSKRNKAEDAINKTKEALDKFGEELYNTFFAWEISLNEIWELTQKIEDAQKKITRTDTMTKLLDSQISSGMRKADESTRREGLTLFQQRLAEQNKIISDRRTAIEESRKAIIKAQTNQDEKAELAYIEKQLKKNLSETERAGYEQAKEETLNKLRAISMAKEFGSVTNNADGTVVIDFKEEKLDQARLNGKVDETLAKFIEDYYTKLSEASADLDNTINSLGEDVVEYYDSLTSLQDDWVGYEEQLIQITEESNKKQIEQVKKMSDSIKKTMDDLLNSVKKTLDERRKQEDNKKTEEDISRKQQRLAALRADTSGGHQVEIAQLEKEIADAQQTYQRSLEDQLIEKLQNQADEAEKQRERQIALQEELATSVNNIAKVNELMIALNSGNLTEEQTAQIKQELLELYRDSNGYEEKGIFGKEKIDRDFENFYQGLITNQQKQQELITSIEDATEAINELKQSQSNSQKPSNSPKEDSIENVKSLHDNYGWSYQDLRDERGYTNAKDYYDAEVAYDDVKDLFSAKALSDAGYKIPAATGAQPTAKTYKQVLEELKKKSDKQLTYDDINALKKAANKEGITSKTYLPALAKGKPTWKKILTLLKASKKWNSLKLAKTFNSSAFKEAYDKVYGKGKYASNLAKAKKQNIKSYETGGLADYTGPAWLDGTPSRPELILNAADTKNFIALRDILSKVVRVADSSEGQYGNATYEININVDKIASDYDVDKMAERVKKIIVKDSSYRNVTQVRKFR